MTTAMKRPQIHDLVKEAMAGTVGRVDITAEANRQLLNLGQEPLEKQASARAPREMVPTEYIEKLAGALDYAAGMLKRAEEGTTSIQPGEGPNALQVMEAPGGENPVQPGNQGTATSKNTPPQNPPMQSSGVAKDPSNAMATNDDMMHGEQPVEPISNEKTSSVLYAKNLAALGLVKEGFSISPEGHEYDAALARAQQGLNEQQLLAARAYEDEAPIKSQLTGIGTGLSGFPNRLAARHAAYAAAKHEDQRNPLNPFGGMLTPTPAEEQLKRASVRKQALAISPEGHKYDATMARARQQAAETGLLAGREYEDEAPIKSQFTGIGTGISGFPQRLAARHAAYVAAKHEDERNPLNPFGGMLTPTPAESKLKRASVKQAFSISPEGHKYDATTARAKQRAAETHLKAARKYEDKAPIKSQLTGIGAGISGFPKRLEARHAAYVAAKHEDKRNAYNPLGGLLTKTKAEKELSKKGSALYARNLAALGLYKLAEDAINPAQISAGPADAMGANPPPAASPAQEQVPSEPSDVTRQKNMIGSNEAAINYTRAQAKADPKSDVGDVVSEPALSASTDKTLDLVFDRTREAGAKIASDRTRTAAAQALLAKYAAEAQKAKVKQSQGMGAPGAPGAGPVGSASLPNTPQAATGMSTANM